MGLHACPGAVWFRGCVSGMSELQFLVSVLIRMVNQLDFHIFYRYQTQRSRMKFVLLKQSFRCLFASVEIIQFSDFEFVICKDYGGGLR